MHWISQKRWLIKGVCCLIRARDWPTADLRWWLEVTGPWWLQSRSGLESAHFYHTPSSTLGGVSASNQCIPKINLHIHSILCSLKVRMDNCSDNWNWPRLWRSIPWRAHVTLLHFAPCGCWQPLYDILSADRRRLLLLKDSFPRPIYSIVPVPIPFNVHK